MKNHNVLLVSLLISFSSIGQEVISNQGETYSNTNGTIDFTLGEVVINTVSSGTNDITQGFHQTNWSFVGIEDLQPDYEVSVFPNPMETQLLIQAEKFQGVKYELFDSKGKIVKQAQLVQEETHIDVQHVSAGAYQLRLTNELNQPLKKFTLIKQQTN